MDRKTYTEEVKEEIKKNPIVLLYIGQNNCGVCHSLKPQVENIMLDFDDVKKIELDASQVPEVAEAFQVLTVPVILLFIEGKEYLRRARIVHLNEFKQDVTKIITGYKKMQELE